MRTLGAVAACLVLGLGGGCGFGPPPTENKDPEVYARRIKQQVYDFVADANKNLKAAPREAAVLLETLEVHKDHPVGDHAATYAELTERCRELAAARGTDVRKKVDALAASAKKLPGEVEKRVEVQQR
jgi:hypothetical protein